MGVLSQTVARGDLLLRRGVDEAFAVRWLWDEGDGFKPKDLTEWTATCELRSPSGDVWASLDCETTADGLAFVRIPAELYESPEWAGRAQGTWRIDGIESAGRVERLGDGYFYLEG